MLYVKTEEIDEDIFVPCHDEGKNDYPQFLRCNNDYRADNSNCLLSFVTNQKSVPAAPSRVSRSECHSNEVEP